MTITNSFVLFFAVLALSLALSPLVMKISLKADLIDDVNHRSSHKVSTPRGGGLIFIFSSAIVLLLNYVFHLFTFPSHLLSIVVLSYACALLGFLDDKYSLPSWWRFLVQFLLVLYPVLHMPLIFQHLSAWLQYGLCTISWLWFINLFNFMDGTDGYAAQESLFILLFILVVDSSIMPLAIVLIASVLGFLKVNYPKASIFMGDAGSYFLGYLLFGLMLFNLSRHISLIVPCIIISLLFTSDATYTLIKRMANRESFFQAHRSHWYQRLYNLGYSHGYIFWMGVLINIILFSFALLSMFGRHYLIDALSSIFAIGMVACFIVSKEKRLYPEKTQ